MSKQERTGWRDEALSARHRMWGNDCPAVDLDFVLVEYVHEKPKAIVEYKNEHADAQYTSHPSYKALVSLGDCSGILVIAVRYADDFSWWNVVPLNEKARSYVPQRTKMDEKSWVTLLHRIRGKEVPNSVLARINGDSMEIL